MWSSSITVLSWLCYDRKGSELESSDLATFTNGPTWTNSRTECFKQKMKVLVVEVCGRTIRRNAVQLK